MPLTEDTLAFKLDPEHLELRSVIADLIRVLDQHITPGELGGDDWNLAMLPLAIAEIARRADAAQVDAQLARVETGNVRTQLTAQIRLLEEAAERPSPSDDMAARVAALEARLGLA